MLAATIVTLFPEMFPGPLGLSLAGKALRDRLWSLNALNLRDFATDKHRTVDDTPYGGGSGMVLKPDIVDAALRAAGPGRVIYMSPRGTPMNQTLIQELKDQQLVILCGRFEGVDQRVLDAHDALEISLGDFILSGGEIAALALLDACVRLIPGVLGDSGSLVEESFTGHAETACLLEYPHYTKPPFWNGFNVPEVLMSGHHEQIRTWRLEQSKAITKARRPDLWEEYLKRSATGDKNDSKE